MGRCKMTGNHLAVVILRAGKMLHALFRDIELQPLEICQILAVNVHFDGIPGRGVEHPMNVVIRREQTRDHARCITIDCDQFQVGETFLGSIVEALEARLLQLVFHHTDQPPGLVIVRLGCVAGTPDDARDIEQGRAVQHVASVAARASSFVLRRDALGIAYKTRQEGLGRQYNFLRGGCRARDSGEIPYQLLQRVFPSHKRVICLEG